jgi:hypothetical protein
MRVARRETADVLSDLLQGAGYATVWQSPALRLPVVRGAAAGIWVGGQLSDHEADDLREFCRQMARDAAPVVALLDFPRRDCVDRALKIGAATVFGMPWLNADLVATLQLLTDKRKLNRAA